MQSLALFLRWQRINITTVGSQFYSVSPPVDESNSYDLKLSETDPVEKACGNHAGRGHAVCAFKSSDRGPGLRPIIPSTALC
jgi:hypothetical protein